MTKYLYSTFILLTFGASFLLAQSDRDNLQLRVEPAYFSPNKDALQDQLFLYPVLKSSEELIRWRLEILQHGKERIARLSGPGLPALIKWDGLDKKGNVAPDGLYTARLSVTGRSHEFSATRTFSVDTKPPSAGLTLSPTVIDKTFLNSRSLVFTPSASDESPLDRWLLQVIDTSGRTVEVVFSSGPVHEIIWDGSDQSTKVLVPQGTYRCVFQAWDQAGNDSEPVFADFTVNVTAREMLQQALHRIQVNETAIGLIIQLNYADLFQLKRKGIELSNDGMETLTEAAILINAYPEVPVKLDGYAKFNRQAPKDRDQGSLYAWKVYSYLVKAGNVKASRLMVRGRGRSAMFDRRTVTVPTIRNGVEVILEGNGPW